ncbi:MAG: guanylate kinase [Buchnera aphidicola (Periphyllus acericola)]|uniref:guanylate kinase n=1 Tax=Buchnera aphidicola TaxID=9 RepID=UPI0030D5CFB2|nr:guanylate kinase [Buchnera aphidicola (Periphyllus acericola)]
MINTEKIFIISAPSGTGKSSLIKAFLKKEKIIKVKLSISFTTRLIRPNEKNGIDYYFISKKKFKCMIKKNKFLEYAKVFNNYYGTSLKNTKKILVSGKNILFDIDWKGARQIKKIYPHSKSIFLIPPSKKELLKRLYKRNQDTKLVILKRMKNFLKEMKHYLEYDYLIINDNFDYSISNLKSIIHSYSLLTSYQDIKNKKLIHNLLEL